MENCGPDPSKCYNFKSGRKGRLGKLKQKISHSLKKMKKEIPSRKKKPDNPPPVGNGTHRNPRDLGSWSGSYGAGGR